MTTHGHDLTSVMAEYDLNAADGLFIVRAYCGVCSQWHMLSVSGNLSIFEDQALCECLTAFEAAARGIAASHGVQLQLLFD